MIADGRFKITDVIRTTTNGKLVSGEVVKVGWFDVTIKNEMGGLISIPNGKLVAVLENITQEGHKRIQIELGINYHHSIKVHSEMSAFLSKLGDEGKLVKSKARVLLRKFEGEKKLMVLIVSCITKKELYYQINADIHSKLVEVITACEDASMIPPADPGGVKVTRKKRGVKLTSTDRSVAVSSTNDVDVKVD